MAPLNFKCLKCHPVSWRIIYVTLFLINFVAHVNSGQICVRNPPLEYIGTFQAESFYKFLCNTKLFVDRTEFITQHIANESLIPVHSVEIIAFPKGFGKSLNMLLFRFFFEIEVYPDGTEIPQEETNSYQFFTTGKFKDENGTEITFTPAPRISDSKYKNIVRKHCAKYPVIHVDFKSFELIPNDTYDTFLEKFGEIIQITFKSHMHLEEYLTKKVDTAKSKWFRKSEEYDLRFFLDAVQNKLDRHMLQQSIQRLSKILKERFSNKFVIILIDEYDQILHQIFLHDNQFSSELKRVMLHFFTCFYISTLTTNCGNYYRAILTGLINFQLWNLYEHFDFILSYSYNMYSPNVNNFYGISVAEANQLFDTYQIKSEQREIIKRYYGGYKFLTRDRKFETFYNTFSIVNYLNYLESKPNPEVYWTGSGVIDGNIHAIMNRYVRNELEPLLSDNCNSIQIFGVFGGPSLTPRYLQLTIYEMRSLEVIKDVYAFLKLLIATGHLTWDGDDSKSPRFVFPNMEVSKLMLLQFVAGYKNQFGNTYVQLAKELKKFLFDDKLDSEELRNAFMEFTQTHKHDLLPYFSPHVVYPTDAESTIELNEAYFVSVLRAAAFWIKNDKTFVAFEHQVSKGSLNIYFHNYKDRQAIVELKYKESNKTINDAVSQLSKYHNKQEYKCKYIAVLGKIDGSIEVQATF